MDYLAYLPLLALMLSLGFFIRIISKKARIPWIILLVLTGIILKNVAVSGEQFVIEPQALILFTLFIMTLVIFNDISTITMHEFGFYSENALKLTVMSLAVNMIFLTFFSYLFFGFSGILPSILFVLIISGTDITSILFMFRENKATEVMKYEAILNTPVSLIGSIIILMLIQANPGIDGNIAGFLPLVKHVFLGIGTGVIFSIFTFSLMSRFHHKHISPILLVALAMAAYLFAEFLQGYGLFAIAVYSIVFEKSLLEKKHELRVFSRNFSDFFSVIAFMLLGYILPIGLTPLSILKALAFFAVYILLRTGTAYLTLHESFKFEELFFISMAPAKGLTACAIVLFLSGFPFIPKELIETLILFLLFSIVLSSFMAILSHRIFRKDIEE